MLCFVKIEKTNKQQMPYLNWISDSNLEFAVGSLLDISKTALTQSELDYHKNVIDPFSAIFQIAGFHLPFLEWEKSEKSRQAQKTLQNHVGTFHQRILGSIIGWDDLKVGQGVDLACHSKKIIAEVKNKYNTVTGGKLADQYYAFERLVTPKASKYKDYTAYFVQIIPKNPERYNKEFVPSDKDKGTKCHPNILIREIDGASFYDLATGQPNTLKELFSAIPIVLENKFDIQLTTTDNSNLLSLFSLAYNIAD